MQEGFTAQQSPGSGSYDSLGRRSSPSRARYMREDVGKGTSTAPTLAICRWRAESRLPFARRGRDLSKNILGNILVTKQSGPEGKMVNNLYIEAGCEIAHEYYLALLVDREEDAILVMASTEGGVDIEEVAETTPQAIHKAWTDSSGKLPTGADSAMADSLGLTGVSKDSFKEMLGRPVSMFVTRDCSMVEINPLVRAGDGAMIALDSKISFDDNASFRHPWRAEMRDMSEEEEVEIRANKSGLFIRQIGWKYWLPGQRSRIGHGLNGCDQTIRGRACELSRHWGRGQQGVNHYSLRNNSRGSKCRGHSSEYLRRNHSL
ncbi:MAG: hypothetical protein Ct9H90mP24_6260 [Methanobacteriota archaeon]|nr:MAG: hypothetical protein Ct9H90mP24_6260 [Euryarchaeota archaeon]